MSDYILEMRKITKTFPGVKALDKVDLKVKEKEIHFICGENGAGKSTLMKVLSGVYPYGTYEGDILINGNIQKFKNISESEQKGIAIIYQELALVQEMMVYENIFLGHEITKGRALDKSLMIKEAEKAVKEVGLDVNVTEKVKNLGIGKQQLVEIAKALNKNVSVLILDEPTSALNEDDSENLLRLMTKLKKDGVTLIMISHKLKEVEAIADTVTVIRDGKTITSFGKEHITEDNIINNMVGRQLGDIYPKRENKIVDELVFETKNFSAFAGSKKILNNINIKLKKGEVIGIAGLMGAGRTEFALSIFGNTPQYKIEGEVFVKNEKVNLKSAGIAINHGLAYVSEDRKGNGLNLIDSIKNNISITNLKSLVKGGTIDLNEEIKCVEHYKDKLKIKTPTIEQTVKNLSGGNQQKVSVAKWLINNPDILILDEPTRGIDVGAKFEIYTLINELIEQGMSIIMISSELLELIGMVDRVYVMAEGELKGELHKKDISEEKIMRLATK